MVHSDSNRLSALSNLICSSAFENSDGLRKLAIAHETWDVTCQFRASEMDMWNIVTKTIYDWCVAENIDSLGRQCTLSKNAALCLNEAIIDSWESCSCSQTGMDGTTFSQQASNKLRWERDVDADIHSIGRQNFSCPQCH